MNHEHMNEIKYHANECKDKSNHNTAGSEKQQALALLTKASFLAFYKCRIIGFQDTLYAKRRYQLFRECEISGTVDFIFGDATAVFRSCYISARKPLAGQSNTVTAQGRDVSAGKGGFVIHNCIISATSELIASEYTARTYLGRPWRDFARTVVMQSYLDNNIDPQGWLEFDSRSSYLELYYTEYGNSGPGSATYDKAKWKGFRVINSAEAYQFTVREFIDGDMWIPATGVPYTPDFIDWSGSLRRRFSKCKVFALVLRILATLPI
ncbi:Pectinesterase, putative [Theobroma cacao]|uniref:Pectinesterase n=1 Tax=Theobroma cacao TaxID=3641 RepID=A0A061DRJ0_THECC|nr:Pectinesterase, putative [Theobroma cacao]